VAVVAELARWTSATSVAAGAELWTTGDQSGLEAGEDVCWYSWSTQRASIAKLVGYRFSRVLPSHGRRFVARDAEAMRAAILAASRA